jgi:diguanylate cyclase (GGDEF)-like protein
VRSVIKRSHDRTEDALVVLLESDYHVRKAQESAAWTRAALGALGVALALGARSLVAHPGLAVGGFVLVIATALAQLAYTEHQHLKIEESLAGAAALLIIGLQHQRVTVLTLIWLCALVCGILARGGRVHWVGRTVVLIALLLPIAREGRLAVDQLGLIFAALGLMLVSGRLTRELNYLLAKARYDAAHDDLTGLVSRASFRATLGAMARAASDQSPCTLMLLDLDGFEVVNKTAGHAAGDTLLIGVAELLRGAVVREGWEDDNAGELVGRLGGDEFALIIPGEAGEELGRSLLEQLPKIDDDGRGITGSIGIAHAPRDGSDADSLLRAADIALRVAKRMNGGGQVSEYAGSSLSGHGMQNARAELARVIGGEGLAMAVQPIVDLRNGEVHAYEALARFGAGSKGSPLHWFSLADELGERDALERACLRSALDLLKTRPQLASLAVNVSAPVLLDKRTLALLAETPDLSGLIIEVTEEALVHSDVALSAAVAPLRERGALLAVDDMGAGYSGLRQVTTVHPRYLKLDRSLIAGIDGDPERIALVGALVSYAKRVGSLLVAEGIETVAELEVLLELGVPLAQGYFFSRPGEPWPALDGGALSALSSSPNRVGLAEGARTLTDDHEPAREAEPSKLRAA